MQERLLDMFRMDLRLLGIFRILVGFIALVDTINRTFDLTVFYTDDGLLPRKILLANEWYDWNFSLNMATGSYEGQMVLFGLTMFCAVMVMIGYRTKIFLIFLYILLISIQVRNPQVTHGGDTIVKLIVFFAIFLPVNARYAVDKFTASSLPASGKVLSIATIAYILQAIYIYVFSALSKTGAEWLDGSAVHYALGLEMFEKTLTPILTGMPKMMEFLTYYTYYFEKFGFLLLFIPFAWKYFRLVGVLLFMGLHFGFFLFMTLGNFPWAAIIMWLIIMPPMVGAFLENQGKKWGLYDRLTGARNKFRQFLTKPFFNLEIQERAYRKLGWIPSGVMALVAVAVLCWNLGNNNIINSPPFLKYVVRATATWQEWNMFAPFPMKSDGWLVMDAQLKSGKHIDILNDRDNIIYTKPDKVSTGFKNERWQKYLINRISKDNKNYLLAWGSYYCSCWNKENANTPKELESFSIYFMKEITPPPGQPDPAANKTTVWNHWCKEEFRNRFE